MNENSAFKIINIIMTKGGVGKTTITGMLSYEMCKYGKVLLIDADQQGNLSTLFTEPESEKFDKELLNVLNEDCSFDEALIEVRKPKDDFHGLYLLPTNKGNNKFKTFLEIYFKENPLIFSNILETAKKEGFSYVFIDLPTNWGDAEKLIISKSNLIIPIINTEEFAVNALQTFYTNIQKIKNLYNSQAQVSKNLIVNKYDKKQATQRQYKEIIESTSFNMLLLNYSAAINSAVSEHITIQEYMPSSLICKQLAEFSEKIK